jgi:hypothetical protein
LQAGAAAFRWTPWIAGGDLATFQSPIVQPAAGLLSRLQKHNSSVRCMGCGGQRVAMSDPNRIGLIAPRLAGPLLPLAGLWAGAPIHRLEVARKTFRTAVVHDYPLTRIIAGLCTIWAGLPHRGRTRVKMPANS